MLKWQRGICQVHSSQATWRLGAIVFCIICGACAAVAARAPAQPRSWGLNSARHAQLQQLTLGWHLVVGMQLGELGPFVLFFDPVVVGRLAPRVERCCCPVAGAVLLALKAARGFTTCYDMVQRCRIAELCWALSIFLHGALAVLEMHRFCLTANPTIWVLWPMCHLMPQRPGLSLKAILSRSRPG